MSKLSAEQLAHLFGEDYVSDNDGSPDEGDGEARRHSDGSPPVERPSELSKAPSVRASALLALQ